MEAGAREFNQGRFWHAHEEWERVWLSLVGAPRTRLQAFIQACGAFYLLGVSREDPARRLARGALLKLGQTQVLDLALSVPGLEDLLRRIEAGEGDSARWLEAARGLRASVLVI